MWALILAAALADAGEFEVRTTGGQTVRGTLVELSAERVTIANPDGPATLPTEQVAGLLPTSRPAAAGQKASVWVELVDGSSLSALSYSVIEGQARLALAGGAVVQLPARSIAAVRFKEQTGEIASQWAAIVKTQRTGDFLVIRKKGAIDYLAGVLGDATDETIEFALEDEVLSVKRSKVEGLIYFHPARGESPAAFCRVADAGGSQVEVARAAMVEGELKLTSPAGLELTLPLSQVAGIDFKIQYLSDREPESITWTPFFGPADATASLKEFYRPRMNRGFQAGELRLGGKAYAKGLAVHSRTELVYRLPPGFATFRALAGVDDRVRPGGDVRLVVRGDDKPLFDASITGKDDPLPLELDIRGVKRLAILVDFGGDLDVADYLNLCEPRILK